MNNTERNYIVLEQPIATGDIETLDLLPTGIIYEIGFIITNILPLPGHIWSEEEMMYALGLPGSRMHVTTFYPNIVEQVLWGRTTDQSTIAFHTKRCRDQERDFIREMKNKEAYRLPALTIFREIQKQANDFGVKEVWFNHPQFDVTRLESWWSMAGIKDRPWHYQAEADIASAVRMYRKQTKRCAMPDLTKTFNKQTDAHTGLGDCRYNLAVLSTTGCHDELVEKATADTENDL